MILQPTRSEIAIDADRHAARRFIGTFFALVLPALAVLVGFSVLEDPVRGDLTRVGGYSENDYGWAATHKRFVPPLVSSAYDRPHDIVVIGDSYSFYTPDQQTDPGAYWANYLAQLSGLSVAVIDIHSMTPRELLDHPVFKAAPPRILILEMVERYVVRNLVIEPERWVGNDFDGCPAPGPSPRVSLGRPMRVEPVAWRRDTSIEFNFARAVDVIWKSARRRLGLADNTTVLNLPLDSRTLFSSAASDRLLVYQDELLPADWSEEQISLALCRLRAIQSAVEANGRTAFLFVAAPDKLSVYAPHIADVHYRNMSRLAAIYADRHLSQARLLGPMREAMHSGITDLYLPNDTHWGPPGHEVAARAAIAALVKVRKPGGPAPEFEGAAGADQ
jgi:hypothetical protein